MADFFFSSSPLLLLSSQEALAGLEEVKDLEHVEVLKRKFEDFQKDLVANEARLDNITALARGMIAEGHSDADEIQRQVEVGGRGFIYGHTHLPHHGCDFIFM